MNFHESRFPAEISFGSTGGVQRRTEIVSLVNGFEERNSPWAQSRRRYDAGLGVRSLDDLAQVLSFFEARHGRLYGFRWKDWLDHRSSLPSQEPTPEDQVLVGGGATWQLTKTYGDASASYTRAITKPVDGSVRIAVDGIEIFEGSDFSIDGSTGVVTLTTPAAGGATVTGGFEYDVPVRFDSDTIDVNLAAFEAGEIPSIPVVEVRL
ncbi:MAG: DUF2460 domain-containing protein [Pseudomonadota bacterium]